MQTAELGHITIPTPDQRVFFVTDDSAVQVGRIVSVCIKLHSWEDTEIVCQISWQGEEGTQFSHRKPDALYDAAADACKVAFRHAVGG